MSLPPRRQQKITPPHRPALERRAAAQHRHHDQPSHRPPVPETWEPHTPGRLMLKLVRPLLVLVMLAGVGWGCWWFMTKGVTQIANTTENHTSNVRQIASDIWNDGSSLQLETNDADLAKIIILLRKKLEGQSPQVLVSEDDSGNPRVTHQIHYVINQRSALTVGAHLDPATGKVELAGYEVGGDYQDVMREFTDMQAAAARRQIQAAKNAGPAAADGTEPASAPASVESASPTTPDGTTPDSPAITPAPGTVAPEPAAAATPALAPTSAVPAAPAPAPESGTAPPSTPTAPGQPAKP